mmetsp:Transcript_18821/g.57904  ORF Transcript_18821/g.57904 Transcript_18821/m.57904 type:complete len:507 (-) Transcript_18821:1572-3092(-)
MHRRSGVPDRHRVNLRHVPRRVRAVPLQDVEALGRPQCAGAGDVLSHPHLLLDLPSAQVDGSDGHRRNRVVLVERRAAAGGQAGQQRPVPRLDVRPRRHLFRRRLRVARRRLRVFHTKNQGLRRQIPRGPVRVVSRELLRVLPRLLPRGLRRREPVQLHAPQHARLLLLVRRQASRVSLSPPGPQRLGHGSLRGLRLFLERRRLRPHRRHLWPLHGHPRRQRVLRRHQPRRSHHRLRRLLRRRRRLHAHVGHARRRQQERRLAVLRHSQSARRHPPRPIRHARHHLALRPRSPRSRLPPQPRLHVRLHVIPFFARWVGVVRLAARETTGCSSSSCSLGLLWNEYGTPSRPPPSLALSFSWCFVVLSPSSSFCSSSPLASSPFLPDNPAPLFLLLSLLLRCTSSSSLVFNNKSRVIIPSCGSVSSAPPLTTELSSRRRRRTRTLFFVKEKKRQTTGGDGGARAACPTRPRGPRRSFVWTWDAAAARSVGSSRSVMKCGSTRGRRRRP